MSCAFIYGKEKKEKAFHSDRKEHTHTHRETSICKAHHWRKIIMSTKKETGEKIVSRRNETDDDHSNNNSNNHVNYMLNPW